MAYDSVRQLSNLPVDSLNALKNHLQEHIDSLNFKIEHLDNNSSGKSVQVIDGYRDRLQKKRDSLQNKANDISRQIFNGEGGKLSKHINIEEFENVNKLNDVIAPVKALKETNLPEIKLPENNILDNPTVPKPEPNTQAAIDNVQQGLTELDEIQHFQEQTANLPRIDQFKKQPLEELKLSQEDIIKKNIMKKKVNQAREAFANHEMEVKEARKEMAGYQDSLQKAKKGSVSGNSGYIGQKTFLLE